MDRSEIRKALLEDSKHRHTAPVHCACCGELSERVATEMLWYYSTPGESTPEFTYAQPMGSGDMCRVRFAICDKCAPDCKKCKQPKRSKKLKAYQSKVAKQIGRTPKGQGFCRCFKLFG
mgnify:CR=1 FL=1